MNERSIEIQLCELCGLPLNMRGEFGGVMNKKHGITTKLGYSKGGWGSRDDDRSVAIEGEVCQECFDEIWKAYDKVRSVLKTRKDLNKPTPISKELGLWRGGRSDTAVQVISTNGGER